MTKLEFLHQKMDFKSILLVALLLVAVYSTYSLYVNEAYFIDSAIKTGDLQVAIIDYNYTLINDTNSDYKSMLSITYNLTNPSTPNITISIFGLGASIHNQYNDYVGSNALYLKHKLPAGSSLIFTLGIFLTRNITVAVVFTKITVVIYTKISALHVSTIFDVEAIHIYPPEQQ